MTLTPFDAAERSSLLEVFRDAAVRQYLLDDSVVTPEWVLGEIASSEARFAESGAGLWSVRLLDRPEIIGFAGFREFFDPPQLQLIYGLRPEHWGRGLATEAARVVCDHAFLELGFSEVWAAIDLPNEASGRVLKRLGMEYQRTTDDGAAGTAFYKLGREGGSIPQPGGNAGL